MPLIASHPGDSWNAFNDVLLGLLFLGIAFWPVLFVPIGLFAVAMFKRRARIAGIQMMSALMAPVLVYWSLSNVPSIGRAVSSELAWIGLLLSWAVAAWFAILIMVKLDG